MDKAGMIIFGAGALLALLLPVALFHDGLRPESWLEWCIFVESFFPALLSLWVAALCSGKIV